MVMDVNGVGSLVVIPIFWVACLTRVFQGLLFPERDEEKKILSGC